MVTTFTPVIWATLSVALYMQTFILHFFIVKLDYPSNVSLSAMNYFVRNF